METPYDVIIMSEHRTSEDIEGSAFSNKQPGPSPEYRVSRENLLGVTML